MSVHGTVARYNESCRCVDCKGSWTEYQIKWKAARLADPGMVHGRRVNYVCGCRCGSCKAANAEYNMRRKSRLSDSSDVPHGTTDGYGSYGCRCHPCAQAKATATRDHYVRNQMYFLEKANRRDDRKNRDKRIVTTRDVLRMFDRYRWCCAYCGVKAKLELDHVIPLSRGGRHSIGNLVPSCKLCNRRKSARFVVEWKLR